MKKAKRLLAVLLSALMLFAAASIPSYAYLEGESWHEPIETQNQKYYFSYAKGASWLLDTLDGILVGTGIALNCDELNDLVDIGINIFTSNMLLNADKYLEDVGAIDETGQGAIDIRSVDSLIKSLYGLLTCLDENWISSAAEALGLFGDLLDKEKGLVRGSLNYTVTRANVSDVQVLEMLILWISEQKNLIAGLLSGDCSFGSLLSGLLGDMIGDALPVENPIQDNKINGNKLIKDLLYNLLVDSTATKAPEDGSTIDDWVQHLIDMAIITGTGDGTQTDPELTHPVYGDGANSILGPNAEGLMPAVGRFEGGASITGQSFYQLVNNVINGLFGGMLKDILTDLLYDLLGVEITEQFPYGDPAVLTDQTFTMIVGIVEGLFVDNGAPVPEYTEQQNTYPVYKIDALLDWLLVGKPEENIQSALDTFILIDYYGIHIQDNFMSLLNDVARLLINLLPSLGLFSSSAHLAYTPDELNVSWYIDENYELVTSLEETKVTQTYVTFETNEVIYPTEFVTDANGATTPTAYCYLDDKAPVNTTDAEGERYMNPSLVRPNYVITTKMVFANIIKLALNDFIDGCYFPEWTTDIPSVLAYGVAALAAPIVPENNYYARLDAYHAMLEGEVAPIDDKITTVNGEEIEILRYSISKVITIKDQNGNPAGTANIEIPKAALDIVISFLAKSLNAVFHFDSDIEKFTTDTTLEQFAGEFLIWAANQYLPAFIGEPEKQANGTTQFVGKNMASTNAPIFAAAMTTLVNSVYSDYTSRTIKETANWDVVYDFIDNTLFKLLPTTWLPSINGSAQFVNEWLLGNLVNFDIQGILGLFQVNTDSNAELNNSALKVIINIIDRVTSLIFNDNAVLISSGQTSGRQGAVMQNNVTTLSTLAGLLDCSGSSASLPMLVSNLLTLLNRYKTPILSTVLPLIVSSTYIKSHTEDGFLPTGITNLNKYKIAILEEYLEELYDNRNAVAMVTYDNIEDAEAALATGDEKPMAVKNADGVHTDIILHNGTIFGTYASREEANEVLKKLSKAYIHSVPVEGEFDENGEQVYTYTIYTNISYLTSATGTPATDDGGEYTKYSDFRFSQVTYRTKADPFVSFDDDYYFFDDEDFGKSGFLYRNHKEAVQSSRDYVSTYHSFIENDLVNAYGEWFMFDIESKLRQQDLYDRNGDGRSVKSDTDGDYVAETTDADGNVTDPGFPVDGDPSIPGNTVMYPYYTTNANNFTYYDINAGTTTEARLKTGFIDQSTGAVITEYNTSSFTPDNFEQLALALEYASDPENNVVLSDEDTESIVRLWLGTVEFDITRDGDGNYTGSLQWDNMTQLQRDTIATKAAQMGCTFEIETAEDGTKTYTVTRPAFALFTDGSTFGETGVTTNPELNTKTVADYSKKSITGGQTYAEEIRIAQHNAYMAYINNLYANRIRLYDEIDEVSWRVEKAEDGRKTTADTTILKWVLDLTANDYKDSQTRKRNVVFKKDEATGKNIESKAFTTSSYLEFRDAYDYANSLYDACADANILSLGITQSMVTAAYKGLLSAWQKLVEFTGFADWAQIDNYVAVAEEILNDPYINDPDFGIASGLTELETALKDAYVYTDNLDNPDTVYDLNKNSKAAWDSEVQSDIDSAAALLNQAIQNLTYNKKPGVLFDPEAESDVKIQDTKYENQIQYSHIYGLEEGVGFGDGTLEIGSVLEMLGLKVTGMTVDGLTSTVTRTNSARGSGTDARIDGRYQNFLRFRYFAILYGDINGDTRVDGTDAAALNLYIARGENTASIMGEAKYEAADVTHDGGVDAEDVQAIVNHYSLVQDSEINQDAHSPVAAA
ncbi:MAG: dockerin type I repeat-containing protein [Acutalibacteraceae bacterium]|nr:dockerin type I repeat-containing protein [Acutalibacteraceae bacterium]